MTKEQKEAVLRVETLKDMLTGEAKKEFEKAIETVLSMIKEREQDKNRIKELEEHQKKFYNGELYTAKQLKQIEENQKKYFINKQRVKDKIKEIQEDKESEYYYMFSNFSDIQKCIEVLEELLEEKQ